MCIRYRTQIAGAHYATKGWAEAKTDYEKVLALYPANLEMKLGHAWAQLLSGNKKAALDEFNLILTVMPGNALGLAGWRASSAKKKK